MLAVLQFDAASADVLDRMLAAGRLPTLAALRERGHVQPLDTSPLGLFPSGTYPTLYTGIPVGDHGIYSAFPWSATEQRVRFMQSFPLPTTVWERLSPTRRSLVVDPYDSWPPGVLNGIAVSGWQYRNRVAALQRWSVPDSVHAELARTFGPPALVEDAYGAQSASRLLALRPTLVDAPGRVVDAAIHLLARERFDLVWLTFSAAHFAGHFVWDASQFEDGNLSAADRVRLAGTLEDVYAATDAALELMFAALPADSDAVVLSPIGMGTFTSRADFLPDMLQAVLTGRAARGSAGSSMWRLRAALPVGLRAAIARALPERAVRSLAARLYLRGVDWAKTRAFVLPGEHNGYVRLNLRGRERDGVVEATEADTLLDEIAEGLATFRDADGCPAVGSVVRVSTVVQGERAHALPDLVVRWSPRSSAGLEAVSSPVYGEIARHGEGAGLAGHHREDAWAILLPGPDARLRLPTRVPHLIDVAATACAMLGTDARELSGEPLLARF